MSAIGRAIRTGGRVIQRSGIPLVRLDVDLFLEEARVRTGLDDFGDDAFLDPLQRVIDDWEHESKLSIAVPIGAPAVAGGALKLPPVFR